MPGDDLRKKVAQIIFDIDMQHGGDEFIDADAAADAILNIPEIREALELVPVNRKVIGERDE